MNAVYEHGFAVTNPFCPGFDIPWINSVFYGAKGTPKAFNGMEDC